MSPLYSWPSRPELGRTLRGYQHYSNVGISEPPGEYHSAPSTHALSQSPDDESNHPESRLLLLLAAAACCCCRRCCALRSQNALSQLQNEELDKLARETASMSSFLPISLQVRQIVSKLCEDSETLPPGYLIDQLTKMTFDRLLELRLFFCLYNCLSTAMPARPSKNNFSRSWRRILPTSGSRLCALSSLCARMAPPISSGICSVRLQEFAAACNGRGHPILHLAMPSTRWCVMLLRSASTQFSTRSPRLPGLKFQRKV